MLYDAVFFIGLSYAINTLLGFLITGFVFIVILCSELRRNRTFRIIALLCVVDLIQLFCFAVGSVVVIGGERSIHNRPCIEKFAGALIQGSWMAMAYLELALAVNRLSVITGQKWLKIVEIASLVISVVVGVYFTLSLLLTPTHAHMDPEILTWKSYHTTPFTMYNFKIALVSSVVPMALNVVAYVIIGIYIAVKKVVTRWNEIRFLVAVIGGFVYTLFLACFYHYWYDIFNESRTVWVIQHHAWIFLFTFVCSLHLWFNSELRKNALKLLRRQNKVVVSSVEVYVVNAEDSYRV